MPAFGFNHISIKTGKADVTRRFYERVFGMVEAQRPPFEFPGFWMQLGTASGGSIFHIYTGDAALDKDGNVPVGSKAVDHIALSATGFGETRQLLKDLRIPFGERPVPGLPIWQIFFYDPNGIQFELQYHSKAEARDGVQVDPDNWIPAGREWFDENAYRQFETE